MNYITLKSFKTVVFTAVLTILSFYPFHTSFAQAQGCAFDEVNARYMAENPEFVALRERYEKNYRKLLANPSATHKAAVYTVPVVFHIIHLGEDTGVGSNIPEDQVASMIDGMNAWFRNKYPSGNAVHPSGIDIEMEFCLAKTDPSGQPTTGVLRADGRVVHDYEQMGCMNNGGATENEAEIKALSKWDKNDYYNVWIVHRINDQNFATQGGTAGYAYFPGAGANVDGTILHVLTSGWVASGNRNDAPAHWGNLNSADNGTLNHELGHAFSLYHTFNGGGNSPGGACPTNGPCATDGDRVCDTDPHVGDLGNCRPVGYANPCTGGTYDVYIADNIMNYTNCSPLLFTPGQKARIRAELEPGGGRYSLTQNSSACFSPLNYDLAVTEISQPSQFYCDPNISGKFKVKNLAKNQVTSFRYIVGIDGTDIDTVTWTGTLGIQTEIEITTPTYTAPIGNRVFNIRTDELTINGSNADERTENDAKSKSFEIINGEEVTVVVDGYEPEDYFIIRDDQGGLLYQTQLDANGSYSEDFCLRTNACYTFELVDQEYIPAGYTVGGKPGKVPTYEVRNDLGQKIIGGYNNAPGQITRIAPYSETEQFCLPFVLAGITANFNANQTIILMGEDVQFSDQTVAGDPAFPANSWNWDFGDGSTDNVQNPLHTYWTAGLYTVTLTANNANNLPSTATKKQYIRVIDNTADCITLDNLVNTDSPSDLGYDSNLQGYLTGPSSIKTPSAFGERFLSPGGQGKIKSVDVYISNDTKIANAASQISMSIYSENAGLPNNLLTSEDLTYGDLNIGGYTTFQLATPLDVNTFFYVTLNMPTGVTGDTIVIGSIAPRGSDFYSNTAYVYSNGVWKTVPSIYGTDKVISLAIRVNMSPISKAIVQPLEYKTCINQPVQVSGASSVDATIFSWNFPGGLPASSNREEPTVNYSTPGSHTIKLFTKAAACALADSTIAIVKVSGPVSDTVLTIQETCGASDGYAELQVSGGSGVFTYEWFDGTTGSTQKFNMSGGNYTVKWVDKVCLDSSTLNFKILADTKLAPFTVNVEHTTCDIDNGKAAINAFGGGLSYNWTMVGNPGFTHSDKIGNDLEPGTYDVFTQRGSCTSDPQSFTIDPSTDVKISVDPFASSLCASDSLVLTATVTNGSDSIRWYNAFGDTLKPLGFGSIKVAPLSTTVYKAYTVRTADGCSADTTVQVNVINTPTFFMKMDDNADGDYQHDSVTVGLNNAGTVYYSSNGSVSTSFLWEFGDGDISTARDPKHSYADTGTYKVRLTLGNGNCAYSEERTVFVVDSAWAPPTDTTGNGNGNGNGGTNSITELNYSNSVFTAYPNPLTNTLNLKALNNDDLSVVELYNSVGKKLEIEIEKTGIDVYSISVSNIAAGNYIVKAVLTDKVQISNIVVIK